ncbi:hypothetical protein J4474_01120 [Candidatus Pacearchaeota archaeon]|nr:hypothetical protein [Candidatus Pacearchaeota archaeon]
MNDFSKQKEFIVRFQPEYFLIDQLENFALEEKEDFESLKKQKRISEMSDFEKQKELIEFCEDKGIKLVGIDMPNLGVPLKIAKKINKRLVLSEEEKFEIEETLPERARHQIEKIKEYTKKTDKPIIVSLSAWFMKENSELRDNFSNYLMGYLSDADGKVLISKPEKGQKIFWREIEKF